MMWNFITEVIWILHIIILCHQKTHKPLISGTYCISSYALLCDLCFFISTFLCFHIFFYNPLFLPLFFFSTIIFFFCISSISLSFCSVGDLTIHRSEEREPLPLGKWKKNVRLDLHIICIFNLYNFIYSFLLLIWFLLSPFLSFFSLHSFSSSNSFSVF